MFDCLRGLLKRRSGSGDPGTYRHSSEGQTSPAVQSTCPFAAVGDPAGTCRGSRTCSSIAPAVGLAWPLAEGVSNGDGTAPGLAGQLVADGAGIEHAERALSSTATTPRMRARPRLSPDVMSDYQTMFPP